MPGKDVKRIVSVIRFLASFTIDPEAHVIILKSLNRRVNQIKLMLVDPLKIFTNLLNGAKCIVLAGGTMDPMGEYKQLFSSLSPDELHICDCAHVIPPASMQLSVIHKGLNNEDLTLTYERKNSPETLAAIGKVLERLCELVPNGIVCFFSSFDHVAKFVTVIRDNGTFQRIDTRKQIFEDKRNSAIFNPYEEAARSTGAILFTVIRGSLSEGINFKHEVGRCAVIIGQPFPNAHEPEMKEKMSFWDSAGGEMKGKDYLQNLCYKAVNQCIGRVIRDSQDYAVVVLIDSRYLRAESMEKLSSWTKRNWARTGTLDGTFEAIRRFFEGKSNGS
jgi:chromosome transmission fidelity protein 1